MLDLRFVLPVLCLLAVPAAQAQIRVTVGLPTVRFEAPPPLVVVEPGIQVVPDQDEEVFYADDYYWVRRGPTWYRTHDHHGGWVVAEAGVPTRLAHYKPGAYRHYREAPVRVAPVIVRTRRAPPPTVIIEERGHGREDDREGDHGRGHGRGHDNGKHRGHD